MSPLFLRGVLATGMAPSLMLDRSSIYIDESELNGIAAPKNLLHVAHLMDGSVK